jgi:hypothetical protein
MEICNVSHFITQPRRFLAFQLEKSLGKTEEQNWTKPPGSAEAGKPGEKAPPPH